MTRQEAQNKVNDLKQKYPAPKAVLTNDAQYCVGGALCLDNVELMYENVEQAGDISCFIATLCRQYLNKKETDSVSLSFPSEKTLGLAIRVLNPAVSYIKAQELADDIIVANDDEQIDAAWDQLVAALCATEV